MTSAWYAVGMPINGVKVTFNVVAIKVAYRNREACHRQQLTNKYHAVTRLNVITE